MKRILLSIMTVSVVIAFAVIGRQRAQAQTSAQSMDQMAGASMETNTTQNSAPYVTEIPPGYRDWRVISVAHEEGNLHSFSIVLGNDIAIKAYRQGTLPYPDGTIIAALHYHHVPSAENNKIFGKEQSFVPGDPSNIQFMIKDSKKYAATGGWGFGHFQNGKPAAPSMMVSCFPCHNKIKARDLVFTRYAP